MRSKNHRLKKRGRRWYLRYDVPEDVRHHYPSLNGRTQEKALRTFDVAEARLRRDQELRRLDREWHSLRQAGNPSAAAGGVRDYGNTLEENAAAFHWYGEREQTSLFSDELAEQFEVLVEAALGGRDPIAHRAEVMEEVRQSPEGRRLIRAADIASGKVALIQSVTDEWMETKKNKNSSTLYGYRKAFEVLTREFETFEEVTRQKARNFLVKLLNGRAKSTVMRYVSAYRGLWYHVDRDMNLWSTHGIDGNVAAVKMLPWSDEDYLRLLKAAATELRWGRGDRRLYLAIRIAAHTGASLGGISNLTLLPSDEGLSLYLEETKTAHRSRTIPCHPEIEQDVAEWVKNPVRAEPLSQRFGRLKTSLGYGRDKVFHSFRHSVVKKLEHQRLKDREIKRLIGHKLGTITFDTYNADGLDYQVLADIIGKINWPRPPDFPRKM